MAAFLAAGAAVDALDSHGGSVLHHAATTGLGGQTTEASIVTTARHLLAAGAPANARGSKGRTPLHHACGSGHAGLIELLLDAGAGPMVRMDDGMTPLHVLAARSSNARDRAEGAIALLERGADPNARAN